MLDPVLKSFMAMACALTYGASPTKTTAVRYPILKLADGLRKDSLPEAVLAGALTRCATVLAAASCADGVEAGDAPDQNLPDDPSYLDLMTAAKTALEAASPSPGREAALFALDGLFAVLEPYSA